MPMKSLKLNPPSVSKWQIALAVGTPVVVGLGLGAWYYYSQRHSDSACCSNVKEKPSISVKGSSVDSLDEVPKSVSDKDESAGSLEDKAEAVKIKGNQFFKEGRYDDAIKCYSEAIALCPPELTQNMSMFYQNKAAAHEKLNNYEEVILDLDRALDLNPKYTKALNRRAKVYERTNQLKNALLDATAICILEEFQNQSSLLLADRVLKELGKQRAAKEIKNRKPVTPSKYFIRSYFSSFAEDPVFQFPVVNGLDDTNELKGFLKAQRDVLHEQYDNIMDDCTAELQSDNVQTSVYVAESLLLRATFAILRGQSDLAFADLDTLLKRPEGSVKIRANALIKLASLKIQHEQIDAAFVDFKSAVEIDTENADIYHHRGQVNLLLEKMDDAVADFERASRLNPKFAIAAVQRCYADYRYAFVKHDFVALQSAMNAFLMTIQNFPDCAEGYTLYAQALVDQQEFEKADRYFDKALVEDPNNANIYVHKGLLQLSIKQDYDEAVALIKKAINTDDRCEFAYETLGALEVQRGDLDNALKLFDRALILARTELELSHLYSLREAADAQKVVAKRLGISIPRYNNI